MPNEFWSRLRLKPNWRQRIDAEQNRFNQAKRAKLKQDQDTSYDITKRRRMTNETIQNFQTRIERFEIKLDAPQSKSITDLDADQDVLPEEEINAAVAIAVRYKWDGNISRWSQEPKEGPKC